jgi:hypothetical protein
MRDRALRLKLGLCIVRELLGAREERSAAIDRRALDFGVTRRCGLACQIAFRGSAVP